MPTFSQMVRLGRKSPRYKTSSPALRKLPAEARGMYSRLYADAQEAEFGIAEGRARALDQ